MPIATSPPHPHLPVPLGQLSVWQQSTRNHPLLNAGQDDELPEEADVVIVGSGMCGAYILLPAVVISILGSHLTSNRGRDRPYTAQLA